MNIRSSASLVNLETSSKSYVFVPTPQTSDRLSGVDSGFGIVEGSAKHCCIEKPELSKTIVNSTYNHG